MHTSDNGSNSKVTGTYTSDGLFLPDRIAPPSELARATTQAAPAQSGVDLSSNFTGEENSGYGPNGAVVQRVNPEYETDLATGKRFYVPPIFKLIPRENKTVIRRVNPEWEIDPTTGNKFYVPPIFGTFTGEENIYTPDASQSTTSRLSTAGATSATAGAAPTSTADSYFTGRKNNSSFAERLKSPLTPTTSNGATFTTSAASATAGAAPTSAADSYFTDRKNNANFAERLKSPFTPTTLAVKNTVQPAMTAPRLNSITGNAASQQAATTGEEFPITGAQTYSDPKELLANYVKSLYYGDTNNSQKGEAKDHLLNSIKKIGSLGLAGLEAAQGLAEDSVAGAEQIGSDILSGLAETAGAVGSGVESAVNTTAQGLTQAFSTIASPIAESLSNNKEISAATDILLDIARSLEYLGTGAISDFEAISDIQVSNLMGNLRNIRILGFPLPEEMSRRLSEVEDALLNFSITKSWEQSIEDRYHPNEQEKHAGKFLQKFSAGLYPYILDFVLS